MTVVSGDTVGGGAVVGALVVDELAGVLVLVVVSGTVVLVVVSGTVVLVLVVVVSGTVVLVVVVVSGTVVLVVVLVVELHSLTLTTASSADAVATTGSLLSSSTTATKSLRIVGGESQSDVSLVRRHTWEGGPLNVA